MANTTKNLEDLLNIVDVTEFEAPVRVRVTKNLSDSITLSSGLGSNIHYSRINIDLFDSIALLSNITYAIHQIYFKNLEDTLLLTDVTEIKITDRTIMNLEDGEVLADISVSEQSDRTDISLDEFVHIVSNIDLRSPMRYEPLNEDIATLIDEIIIQYGIIVINGQGTGSYNINDVVQLGATTPPGFTFFKWNFNKVGISNIYDPDATVTVPYGGGVITALFVKTGSLVTIYDIYDFEYIDNEDINDEIHTNETASPTTGGFMGVANHDFEIPQGARFHNIMIYRDTNGNPVDLTGYTAEMQIRKYKAASDPSILTLNTSNGYLALGGEEGTITIDTPGNITDSLDFKWGYYDLELYSNGDTNNTIRILEGRIELSKQVTR